MRSSFTALLGYLTTLQPSEINHNDDDQRIYVVVRLLEALTSACLDTAPHEDIIDALFHCYPTLRRKNDSGPTLYLIKRALVNILNHVVDCLYFDPIRYAKDGNVMDEFSKRLLGWIEKSDLDTTYHAFIDGPLVMDWQIECSVSNTLHDINRECFNGDEDRIEFLQLSMEQVRDMNTATETWKDKIRKQRERKLLSTVSSISDQPSVEEIAKISQIQDLFPDLGQGFIKACLLEYNDDVETVIMQLLEDNLPPKLAEMDRSLVDLPVEVIDQQPDTTKKSILASRRNIFDNDEFDLLSGNAKVDISKMHIGKKSRGTTESLLDDKSFIQEEKANVIQRVYDMYDDEYDDTYDGINEAPGTAEMDDEDDSAVDKVKGSKKKQPAAQDPGVVFESTLIHTYVDNRDVFNRSSAVRRSKARAELRKVTGMSDEQLEGWAIMLDRSPRRQRILDKYMLFDGQQEKVDGKSLKETQQKQVQEKRAAAQDETKQRAYKDKNKARFGNHNRKRGHDKKMQKAGVMGNN
ncbi:hypothetical protein K492DRAFT_233608 [Lichtheimia hyalospora FSU 10163]|nr:hypothetical protein K492DRAFT_233608 [Lichtheimia hyalospora FSU 10163]